MLSSLLVAAAFQVGPFYQQRTDYVAARPFYAHEGETTDVVWPLFTSHRDWWRCCWLLNGQTHPDGGCQYSFVPFWFNGRDAESGSYWGLFPFWGRHPHIGMMYDVRFALWPFWMRYRMPRPSKGGWLETETVCFPFLSWRSDGSWSIWPFYGCNRQRESDHRYVLWPLVTWASYREDRDTAGEGTSWTVLPFYGQVRRARERQTLVLPPFFSFAQAFNNRRPEDRPERSSPDSVRVRCPWPFFEFECTPSRERLSVWPFYERARNVEYATGKTSSAVTRFGWKLVELYDDETRVFPFYVSRSPRSGDPAPRYFRLWPLWETESAGGIDRTRALALFPIRWVPAVDRNWAKFWTFYERKANPLYADHSLLWGIVRWRTFR